MMAYDEALRALESMAQSRPNRPSSLRCNRPSCLGCGYEHNCQTEDCTILREALAQMEQLYRDVTGSCWACAYGDVPSDQEPCKSCIDWQTGDNRNWQWRGVVEGDHGGVD